MKATLFSLLMSLLALTACASCTTENEDMPKGDTPETENPKENPVEEGTSTGSMLVAYFSCTNTTKNIAEDISGITEGDLFRIEPTKPYASADLDYNSDCRANREQNDPSARPAIKGMPVNLKDYKIVFLGYPIWWGEAPKVISTFLESGDFKDKVIIPFCTSHSSGIGSSDRNLHSLAPDAVWKAGKRFGASASDAEVENWITTLGIELKTENNKNMDYSKFPLSEGVNGKAPVIPLNSGYDMPIVERRN